VLATQPADSPRDEEEVRRGTPAGEPLRRPVIVQGGVSPSRPHCSKQREWRASRNPMGARGRHIQNAYRKIGVSTRAAATLFAMEHGPVAWGELPIAGRAVRS
jgi:hypothetical protein